ncbi:response regulator transcription factor [Azospirillum soli]|uniref:response regulator transcription factor n=1 Tax=Azospirillum soli TaxID=1304799 RepID=UPI001AE75384|nr:response regulator transcription factor [Azospirillum soli]MBP2312572.1 DNA-binding response OmpR family regulator [Azospirillum soli]
MNGRKIVYVVDDDPDVRDLLRTVLGGFGYAVSVFGSGRAVRAAIRREPPEVAIVDLGLPDMDGLTLVRELWEDVRFGVIVLTGRGDVSDRVLGLELGADDYIVKPFEPRELVARVNTVIRRREQLMAVSRNGATGKARFAEWTFDVGDLTLTADDGRRETLTAAEAALLSMLLKAPRRVLSREQLQSAELDRGDLPFERAVDVRISRIRKKIEPDPRSPKLIRTVYGAGYLFAADVTWVNG